MPRIWDLTDLEEVLVHSVPPTHPPTTATATTRSPCSATMRSARTMRASKSPTAASMVAYRFCDSAKRTSMASVARSTACFVSAACPSRAPDAAAARAASHESAARRSHSAPASSSARKAADVALALARRPSSPLVMCPNRCSTLRG